VNWDNILPNPNLNAPMVDLVAHMCARAAMCGQFRIRSLIFGGKCNDAQLDQCPSLLNWTFDHEHF
jgi:hypothetical protein